jgi:hypothetical protein
LAEASQPSHPLPPKFRLQTVFFNKMKPSKVRFVALTT